MGTGRESLVVSTMSFFSPAENDRVLRVHSFEELVESRFGNGVNAFCWPRVLEGNYAEVVEQLAVTEPMEVLDADRLRALDLSAQGRIAVEQMLEDLRRLGALGLDPVLNCIREYPRDEDAVGLPTHVYSFHVDSAPIEADTFLCTYHGLASSGLRNEEAIQRVAMPETRAMLLKMYGGGDDEGFQDFLSENCLDLHYETLPGARPYDFGVGHLWRIAVEYPGSPVLPCIHRAPEATYADEPRLLLIS
jgi:hypothetical protein